MLKDPLVFPRFWYYTWPWWFVNILSAISIYSSCYHFNSGFIGLSIGISLTMGCVLGEFTAGKARSALVWRNMPIG